MAILLPKRWQQQPQGNVEIDWSNSLCQNLLFAYLPGNPRSLAQRYMPQLGAGYFNSTVITRPGGRVSEFEEYDFISSIDSGSFTFGMAGQVFGPVLASTLDISSVDNGNTEIGVSVGYDTFASSYYVQTFATDNTFNSYNADGNVTAADLSSKTRFVAGTLSTTEVACWLAGTKLGFNTGGWNGTIPQALEVIVTSGYRLGTPSTGFALAGFGWHRVLSPNELAILDENPWQIFKPVRPVFYSIPNITYSYSRPNADSSPLQWNREPAGGTHFSAIDEVTSDPSDYLYAPSLGLVDTMTCSAVSLPTTGTDINVNYTTGMTPPSQVNIALLEGSTVIKSSTVSAASGTITITAAEWAVVSSWPWTPTLRITSQ